MDSKPSSFGSVGSIPTFGIKRGCIKSGKAFFNAKFYMAHLYFRAFFSEF